MNRNSCGVLARNLCVLAFALLSTWANAKIVVVGETTAKPGDEFVISIEAEAGTELTDIDIVPHYDQFAPILRLVSFVPTQGLIQSIFGGGCISDRCAIYYFPAKQFTADTVLALLRFEVDPAAETLIDKTTRKVPFNLGISISGIEPFENLEFTVQEIPEPSTYALMALGVLLIASRVWWRSCAPRRGRSRL